MGRCFSKRDSTKCDDFRSTLPAKPYLLFYLDVYKELCEEKDVVSIAMEASKRWNEMTVESLEPYIQAAEMIQDDRLDFEKLTSQFGEDGKRLEEVIYEAYPKLRSRSNASGSGEIKDECDLDTNSGTVLIRRRRPIKVEESASNNSTQIGKRGWLFDEFGGASLHDLFTHPEIDQIRDRSEEIKKKILNATTSRCELLERNSPTDNFKPQRKDEIKAESLSNSSVKKNVKIESAQLSDSNRNLVKSRRFDRKIRSCDRDTSKLSFENTRKETPNVTGRDLRKTKSSQNQPPKNLERLQIKKEGIKHWRHKAPKHNSDVGGYKQVLKRKNSGAAEEPFAKKRSLPKGPEAHRRKHVFSSPCDCSPRKRRGLVSELSCAKNPPRSGITSNQKLQWVLNWINWLKHFRNLKNNSIQACRKRARPRTPRSSVRNKTAKKRRQCKSNTKSTCSGPERSISRKMSAIVKPRIKPRSRNCLKKNKLSIWPSLNQITQISPSRAGRSSSFQNSILSPDHKKQRKRTSSQGTVLRFVNNQFKSRSQSCRKTRKKRCGFIVNSSKRRFPVGGNRKNSRSSKLNFYPKRRFLNGKGKLAGNVMRGKLCKRTQSKTNFKE